jgi:hypothetical protein
VRRTRGMPTNGALGNARPGVTAPDWLEPLTALRLCRILLNPHSKDRTQIVLSRRANTGDTRALAYLRSTWAARKPTRLACARSRSPVRPLHMARQRGSRQGSHARAPAHQSDHSTWRGCEEADKARMRALPLTSPTTPHGEAARKPTRLACARSRSPVRPLHMARQRGSRQGSQRALPLTSPATPHDRYWFLQTSLPMHRKPLLQPLPQSRTVPAPCIASLDELKPRPLYSVPELCGGRVEGDEQLAHRD